MLKASHSQKFSESEEGPHVWLRRLNRFCRNGFSVEISENLGHVHVEHKDARACPENGIVEA